jgi:hypothetical protein
MCIGTQKTVRLSNSFSDVGEALRAIRSDLISGRREAVHNGGTAVKLCGESAVNRLLASKKFDYTFVKQTAFQFQNSGTAARLNSPPPLCRRKPANMLS